MRLILPALAGSLLVASWLSAAPAPAALVAQAGGASISHDAQASTWTIATGGTSLTLALGPSLDFEVRRLVTASGRPWIGAAASDSVVRTTGAALPFGQRAAGFLYRDAQVSAEANRVRLDAIFDLPSAGLRVTRHYQAVSGSPTFETWNSYVSLRATPVGVSDLNAFQLTIPNGTVHWLTGLLGDSADVIHDSAFTLQQKQLAAGQHVALGSTGRSSELAVPWFAVDGTEDEFYAGLMWSGAWSLDIERTSTGLLATLGLAPMTTAVADQPVDGPHAIFGVVPGGMPQAAGALRSYAVDGIRSGRPLTPLVTYNTWFAYGTGIDEASMRAEMDHVAALGTELFVVDAGWYADAGASGLFDFDSGLGTWQADPDRFPHGLKPLTDHAHSLGMNFGIWVEPERVNLSVVGAPGPEEAWLATHDGQYGSDHAGQICLASDQARQWVFDRLTALIDEVQPDYLKWDNNMWINCDREGHGHGPTDGNFAHVKGLYDLLGALRERYPDLAIENVSGGGNRLDLGMLQWSDVAWMDDRTAPSIHVRHNIQGLSAAFPPAYLLSFVTSHGDEPIHDAPDLSLYFRSRMEAALGLCFLAADLSEADAANIAREIAIYKTMRGTLSEAAGALLTAQATVDGGPVWDVLQETATGGTAVLIHAFQSDDGVSTFNVKPAGLDPATTYEVRSVDAGLLGSATGADLMADGIDLVESPATAAHVLIILATP